MKPADAANTKMTPEELRTLVLEAGNYIPKKHQSILLNLFDLEQICVDDVMTPRSQIEAARSLGLSTWQLARLVVLPQALRIVIPPLGNEFIAMLKDTSLLSILSVRDMTQRMREFQSASFLPFAPFNSAALLYVCLTLAAASLIGFIERKYDVKSR